MTLGNYTGADGLRIKDLPEMRVEGGQVIFDRIPTMVIVRPELSKAGHQYFTFLSEEGCEYLKDYSEERFNAWLKTFRRAIVRYERLAIMFKAIITFTYIIIHMKYRL
jgi:transposase